MSSTKTVPQRKTSGASTCAPCGVERGAGLTQSVRRAAAVYHLFFALLILLFGTGLLVLGIWLRVRSSGRPSVLVYSDGLLCNVELISVILCIIFAPFFISAAVTSIFITRKRELGEKLTLFVVAIEAVECGNKFIYYQKRLCTVTSVVEFILQEIRSNW